MTIRGIPTAVLLAPDAFKGTFTAVAVAAAIARGVRSAGRGVDLCPVADGGEGTAAALSASLGLQTYTADTEDPLGRPLTASLALGDGVAAIDVAAASGLGLVAGRDRDAFAASTAGTGRLILAAAALGARTIYLGAGGSATTDGGAGAVGAIAAGGGLRGAELIVLCDVRTPFEDAARVFGPQKGASPDDVRRLNARLGAQARRLERDPRGRPMTGAAGGLAGGLWAALDARLVAGAGFVLDAVGFDARMRAARAVVTGEGRLDQQSLAGKVVSEVATRARQGGVPCHAIVGSRELDAFGARMLDLESVLEASTEAELERAGRLIAESL
ncbi:MAG TPA: glycerate kinase [Solirubrobacteraceae bacterium]|nr:glycerate kinase [Solirubrobacteraceae bacterium]